MSRRRFLFEPLSDIIQFPLYLLLLFLDHGSFGKITLPDAFFFFSGKFFQGIFQRGQIVRHFIALQADFGARFIQDVDGFVRKIPVRDIALRHLHRGLQRFFFYLYSVMIFIPCFQSFKDLQALRLCRLLHRNRLETPLQRRILLDIFPVFRDRRRTDQLKLPAGKRRF